MKAKDNTKMTDHLGGKMQHKVTERLVYNAKVTTQEIARINELAQASGTTPYDVIVAEIDKQIREL